MPDYHGANSHKSKEAPPEKKVEKIVNTDAIIVKKTFGQKFKGIFFGGEFKNAARYVTAEVFLPAIRNLFVDATTKGVERVVYGESMSQRRRAQPTYGSRIQYNAPVRREAPYLPDQRIVPRPVRRDTNDLVLATREEAEAVLERMNDIIDKYRVASLSDLYELTGLPSAHTDNKWGWTYLNNTEIRQVRDGYLLDLPPAEEI